ncbi:MAG: gluconate 2-dehydrogenase subunit 3 family protein [Bryobacteraceae bacterium]
MSNSEFSRREALRTIALAVAAGGMATSADAQHVHEMAAAEKVASGGVYKPALFHEHEYETLKHLCELTIPGANQGGAPEFIDLLASHNSELSAIFTGGLAWLDDESRQRYKATFLESKPEEQTALLDLIAYRRNSHQEGLGHGIRFFDWARRMTADAYYTSAPGIKEIGYKGNTAVAKFEVPEEAVDYALKRSGLG